MNRFPLLLLAVSWVAPGSVAPAAMILQSLIPEKHDRFHDPADPLKDFIGDPHDWSGVGRNMRWATMISPSYFVTAAHFHPANDTTLYFYTTNDPGETPEPRMIESGRRIGGSDLWLGKLTRPVSSNIEFYPILRLPEQADYDDLEIYTFGLSVDRSSAAPTTVRLGRNQLDPGSIAPVTDGEPPDEVTGETFLFDFDDPGGVGDDESYLQPGDSGGPSFVIHHGAPALVGVHWFIWNDASDPAIVGSADTFLPDYSAELSAAMVGERVTVVSTVLSWDGLGDGNWDSPTRWADDRPGEMPQSINPVDVHTNKVTVAVDGNAYSLRIGGSGRLVVGPASTLATVRDVQVADGTLEIAPTGTLDVGDQLTMLTDSQYVWQLDGPDNARLAATGDVRLGGTLTLRAFDKLRPAPLEELQWYGDETRTILDVAGETTIAGTFDEEPLTVPEDRGVANHGQGHLGRGVFLTSDGPHGQGVTYNAGSVVVDLFQAADGDTNGDRYLDGWDLQAILAADTFGTGNPADWTTGDFNGDRLSTGDDIQAVLATALWDPFHHDPYAAVVPGEQAGAVAVLILDPWQHSLSIDTEGEVINGYLVKSAAGVFTGERADNLGWFTEDTDWQISGGFGFTLTGTHPFGSVVGDEFASANLRNDLTFTYTIDGVAGIYHGRLVVIPEPGTMAMLIGGALALLLTTRPDRPTGVGS